MYCHLSIVLLAAWSVSAREHVLAAVQQSACGIAGFDLSSLAVIRRVPGEPLLDYQIDTYKGLELSSTASFFINVCSNTITPSCGVKKSPAVVKYYSSQGSSRPFGCFNLGDKSQATWSVPLNAPYAVSVKYIGGDPAILQVPPQQIVRNRTIEMRFQCDPTVAAELDSVVHVRDPTIPPNFLPVDPYDGGFIMTTGGYGYDFIVTFRTAAACSIRKPSNAQATVPASSNDSSSSGSYWWIILFCIASVVAAALFVRLQQLRKLQQHARSEETEPIILENIVHQQPMVSISVPSAVAENEVSV